MAAPIPEQGPEALPPTVEVLAAEVVTLYATAERDLIRQSADVVRQGLAAPAGASGRLSMLRRLQDVARRISTALRLRAQPLAAKVSQTAAQHGDATAKRMVRDLIEQHPAMRDAYTAGHAEPVTAHGVNAATLIQLDLSGKLDTAAQRITRYADDAYRAAIERAATEQVLSKLTPAQAQAQAWRELTAKGVTGFTDAKGREWNLSTYVEMATRTAVMRAFNEAHIARMGSLGIQFFLVPTDGHPCPLCAPWEGRILSDQHSAGETSTLAADSDRMVTFDIAGTVDDARTAGLFHPNCLHTLVAYLPGVTKAVPRPDWTEADQKRYRDTQRLRALERAVRTAKQVQEGALTPLEAKRAAREVRAAQANVRAFLTTTDLIRHPRREQLNLGNK